MKLAALFDGLQRETREDQTRGQRVSARSAACAASQRIATRRHEVAANGRAARNSAASSAAAMEVN
jgi:hypothetical protein